MNVLGIHTGHDAALSLVKDGKLISAISMERFSRIKKDWKITKENLIKFLDYSNITLDDIDYVSMGYWNRGNMDYAKLYSPKDNKYPLSIYGRQEMESNLMNHLDEYSNNLNRRVSYVEGLGYTLPDVIDRFRPPYSNSESTHINDFELLLKLDFYDRPIPGFFIDHHVCHASSAYYTSPFDNSMIFTADASMNIHWACSGYFWGHEHRLNIFRNPGYTYGNFYDVATEFCGIGPGTTKAGTLMGLSSFGKISQKARDNWEWWTRPYDQRSATEDMHYCDWLFLQMSGKYPYIKWYRPEILDKEPGHEHFNREFQMVYTKEESDSQEVMDIAADIQYVAERSLVKYSQDLYDESSTINDGNLCVAGGTFLNCNANYKIMTETSFERMHMFPACGDDGVSAGSALYTTHQILSVPRYKYKNYEIMYLGFQYMYQPETEYEAIDYDEKFVAEQISNGKIICWYQGRSEFGPRALGNRSFISDPRRKDMKDIMNSRVKFREWFRPFAPVILNEHKEEWFQMDFESPFMLYTVPCKKPQEIPSAVHIDNTSRVQTLRREDNNKFYDLINSFYEITGVPVVMNTSLNVKGEPIVETPEEVMELFENSDVDILVLNDKMYLK
jgi:carbamoyltransferase